VLIDGVPRYACLTLAVEAEGVSVTTVEGLLRGEELGPVQWAFVERAESHRHGARPMSLETVVLGR